MIPSNLRDARTVLGTLWGLDRPIHMSELGRALRLRSRDPGNIVSAWENGRQPISGPVAVAIEGMLAGHRPWQSLSDIVKDTGRPSRSSSPTAEEE